MGFLQDISTSCPCIDCLCYGNWCFVSYVTVLLAEHPYINMTILIPTHEIEYLVVYKSLSPISKIRQRVFRPVSLQGAHFKFKAQHIGNYRFVISGC